MGLRITALRRGERMSASVAALRESARKCRLLAIDAGFDTVAAALRQIAFDYERQANRIERAEARARDKLARPPIPRAN